MKTRTAVVCVLAATLCAPPSRAQEIKPRPNPDAAPAPAPARAAEEPRDDERAEKLYYEVDGKGGRKLGLRVRLYRLDRQDCDIETVAANRTFVAGDRVRFGVETNDKGYLYIVQRGSSGSTTLLFPQPQIQNNDASVKRGQELVIPGKAWFTFDEKPGTEELQFVFSKKKLDLLQFLVPVAGGAPVPVRPPAGGVEASVLEALQRSSDGSRDLVLSGMGAPAVPVSAASGAVYAPLYAVNAGAQGTDYCVLRLRLNHR